MSNERLNHTPDFKEYEAGSMANAWLIDADTALISPLKDEIEDSTFEAIAARAKMGESVILFSTKDETWLSNKIASRLGLIIGNDEALGNVLMQGKNEDGAFELRFQDENNTNYYPLEEELDWNPARTLDAMEAHDILPASFNVISARSQKLKMGGDVNIEGININMIHVGHDEDMNIELKHAGMFADGTRAAMMRDMTENVTPQVESATELHLNMLADIKKGR